MTGLRVSTRFGVRGIWVRPEALGHRFAWESDGPTVMLTLPERQDDFATPDEPEVPTIPAWVHTARIDGSGDAVAVQIIGVDVEFSGSLSASDKERALKARDAGDDEPLREFADHAQGLWEEGHEVAERAAHAWLSHVRVVSGQPWLGIAVEPPVQYGRSHIFDIDADVRLMSYGPLQSVSIRSGQLALSLDQLVEIKEQVASEGEPPVAESLLADARFLAQEAEVVDSQRAVLIAAAACEIKSKLVMREKVEASKAELLKLVLGRVSNLPQLLDKPLLAALGVSLRTADERLYGQVRRLSERRNEVVHQGVRVEQAEGWQLVVAAGQLFEWLDSLAA